MYCLFFVRETDNITLHTCIYIQRVEATCTYWVYKVQALASFGRICNIGCATMTALQSIHGLCMTSEDVTKLEAADSAVFCPQSRSDTHPKLNWLTNNLRSAIKVQLKTENKKFRPEFF